MQNNSAAAAKSTNQLQAPGRRQVALGDIREEPLSLLSKGRKTTEQKASRAAAVSSAAIAMLSGVNSSSALSESEPGGGTTTGGRRHTHPAKTSVVGSDDDDDEGDCFFFKSEEEQEALKVQARKILEKYAENVRTASGPITIAIRSIAGVLCVGSCANNASSAGR